MMQFNQSMLTPTQSNQFSRGLSFSFKFMVPVVVAVVAIAGHLPRALAHGVRIESEPIQSLQMRAMFESGDPMANAQVTIYSPANPETPWQQLSTDDQGYFVFTPDHSVLGDWEVEVRQAGHGDLVRVEVNGKNNGFSLTNAGRAGHSGQSPVQKWVTIAAVVWGFVGTALFFSQRQPQPSARTNAETSAQPPTPDPQPTINK